MRPLALSTLLFTLALDQPAFASLTDDLAAVRAFKEKVTVDPQGITATWTGNDVCNFTGFTCATSPTGEYAVAGVDFNGFNLDGSDLSLTGFLDKLVNLAFFHANSNGFKGTVPDLQKLQYLMELDLSNNRLSGCFPKNVLDQDLSFLDLRFNEFKGWVPSKLFTQKYSDVIFLNNNGFIGAIPDTIGFTTALYISLANNQLTGHIPDSLGNARNLNEIVLLGNQLTGSIPATLGGLYNLTVFDVSQNQLTGDVPESLCELPALQVLNLTANRLSGTLGPACQKLENNGVLIL